MVRTLIYVLILLLYFVCLPVVNHRFCVIVIYSHNCIYIYDIFLHCIVYLHKLIFIYLKHSCIYSFQKQIYPILIEAKSKRRKVETGTSGRSNRKRVICLRCDKVLNQDNRKYHQNSKHKGQTPSFRILSATNQTLLNFTVIDGDNGQNFKL